MMKWGELSWEAGYLGYPTTDEIVLQSSTDNIGRRQEFQGGHVYWHPTRSNLNAVRGAVLSKYLATGAQNGPLGYPKSDEIGLPDGVGRMSSFEFGNIYFTSQTGAWPVLGTSDPILGKIMGKWAATNYEQGPFGYPIGDEQPQVGTSGVKQDFQGGTIGWPTELTDASDDIGTDWDYYEYDETSCDSCGDDDRITVTGPAHLNVPQPPPTSSDPNGLSGLAENNLSLIGDPGENQMPSCDAVTSDPNAESGELIFCTPTPEMLEREGLADGQARLNDANDWNSYLQPFCKSLPQRVWAGNRAYQCMWREDWTFIYQRNTQNPIPGETPVGRLHYVQEHELRAPWKSPNSAWTGKSAIHFLQGGVSGAATEALLSIRMTCSSSGTGCPVSGPGIGNMPIATNPDAETTFTVTNAGLTSGMQVTNNLKNTFYFSHPQTDPVSWDVPEARYPEVRCDRNDRDQGCVVPAAEPILDMTTRPNASEHAAHIGNAQRSGLPGGPGGVPLSRATGTQA
ncbi:LGFP repeat-containing protein, partial [Rhodococcus sp. O3]